MRLIISSLFVAMLATHSMPAEAVDLNVSLEGLCETVSSDDKSRFRKKLKDSNVKLRQIFDKVYCGEYNLLQFAIKSEAIQTGSYMVKRMPKSYFEAGVDLSWAKSNGFDSSPILVTIENR